MQIILHFIAAHWVALLIGAAVVLTVLSIYAVWELSAIRQAGPSDSLGNGITIGKAKAFDNRSLALRIERLSASLTALKVVNQNVTENFGTFQQQTSSEVTHSLALDVKAAPAKPGEAAPAGEKPAAKAGDSETKPGAGTAAKPAAMEAKSNIGLAAGDMLNDQLNLASQIMNLEMLYERSLTDRLINGNARLQSVLGFQVSITPPAGYQDCVAIVEVAVRMKNNQEPVSLVALIPQEKTYNAQSMSSSSKSIGGSAVASVMTLGYTSKGESKQVFIHRDSDTIAFERDPRTPPQFFDDDPRGTVFGWEFRPVLGRRTVSAGTRQMLAVIAVPAPDDTKPNSAKLEIKTRSYWRRYDSRTQTSRVRWRLTPWNVKGSNVKKSSETLEVPNTATIQHDLQPKVSKISWVNSGPERATVIVEGANFFSGTKVVIGGVVLREEDGSLILKSNQALEFETAMGALASGDAVLSGRFGSSFHLEVPEDQPPVASLYIDRATIKPFRYTKSFRITIDIRGKDKNNNDVDLTLADLQKLPEAILFVGNEPVPMPYDYSTEDPLKLTGTGSGSSDGREPVKKFVRVAAWIPAKTLARSPSVAFRVPFCGVDYQSSLPLSFSEPTVTRMGVHGDYSVFRIAHPLGLATLTVELDQVYAEEEPGVPAVPAAAPRSQLVRTSKLDCQFQVLTSVVANYQNLVVRIGSANVEPYVLAIPMEDRPKAKIDTKSKPMELVTNSVGPVEWSGTGLDAITSASLCKPAQDGGAAPAPAPADFAVYDEGERIIVSFRDLSTNFVGKAEVEFQTLTGDSFRVPLFIRKDTAMA